MNINMLQQMKMSNDINLKKSKIYSIGESNNVSYQSKYDNKHETKTCWSTFGKYIRNLCCWCVDNSD